MTFMENKDKLLGFSIFGSPQTLKIIFQRIFHHCTTATMFRFTSVVTVFAIIFGLAESFAPQSFSTGRQTTTLSATADRRGFLATAAAASWFGLVNDAFAAQAPEYRQGNQVTAFNGLIFNYRGGDFGGLQASSLNEPSVSYAEFNQRLKAGEVEFVEFIAPDGDAAYVTFKAKDGQAKAAPIRIGEGYPIEQHDGYSSPMFCVRAVKNAGVPYKFTVPALAKINKS